MKLFEVGFKVSDGIFSVNMIWANTGNGERDAVTETAQRRAERYGYAVAYVKEINEAQAQENARKGMPMYSIDEDAERKYDLSFRGEE